VGGDREWEQLQEPGAWFSCATAARHEHRHFSSAYFLIFTATRSSANKQTSNKTMRKTVAGLFAQGAVWRRRRTEDSVHCEKIVIM